MKLCSTAAVALCLGAPLLLLSCTTGEVGPQDVTSSGSGAVAQPGLSGRGGISGTVATGMAGRAFPTGQAGSSVTSGGFGSTTGEGSTAGSAGVAGVAGTGDQGPSTGSASGIAGVTGGVAGASGGTAGTSGSIVATGSAGSTGLAGRGGVSGSGGRITSGGSGTGAIGRAGTTGAGGLGGTNAGRGGTAGSGLAGAAGSALAGAPGTAGATAAGPAGTIVPLYTDPGDVSWNSIVEAKQAHPKVPVIAIVNPADGPGSSRSTAYTSGIAKLQGAGIKVIGYVATGYTANSIASVEAKIDQWKSFYPTLEGIFFDEQSDQAADVPYYRTVSQYAKSQGLSFTVGNPGQDTAEAFVGALDAMLIYETDGVPTTAQMGGWHTKYPVSNFGIIPYATPFNASFVASARKYVGYIYLQNDDLPNPWDSLPPYFADLLAALE